MEAKASGNAVRRVSARPIRGCPRNCDRLSIVTASRHWDLSWEGAETEGVSQETGLRDYDLQAGRGALARLSMTAPSRPVRAPSRSPRPYQARQER
jgi:hypothetical protein